MTRQLRAGTRRSRLAIIQTEEVIQRLASTRPDLDIAVETLTTVGDQTTGSLKGKDPGVFTNTLEEALLNKHIDFAVHSSEGFADTIARRADDRGCTRETCSL